MASLLATSIAAFLITLSSGLLALYLRAHRAIVFAVCAGTLIGGALLFLLPDAHRLFGETSTGEVSFHIVWMAAACGFLAFYLLERASHHSAGSTRLTGLGGGIGLAAHSFLDGVVIGQGLRTGGDLGLVLVLAVMLHRLADGVTAVGVMLGTDHGIRQTATILLLTAIAPVAGATAQSFVLVPAFSLALLLSFFSGMLVYLALKHLLPEARRAARSRASTPIFFLAGFIVAAAAHRLSH